MISAIAYNQSSTLSNFVQQGEHRPRITEMELSSRGDIVSVHKPEQMTDGEISQTMQFIEDNVCESPTEALSVYGNLDYSRVMALLNDPV